MGPLAWSPTLSASSSTIPSGASSQVVFSLTVPSDASANAQSGMAMVHAYSEACGDDKVDCEYEENIGVSLTANQMHSITIGYYTNETGVEKSRAEVEEGMQVQMYVTVSNGGNGNDRVTIELIDAPSWVIASKDTALLSVGGSEDIAIDVLAPASDVLGEHTFQVQAVSQDGMTTSTTGDLTVTVTEKSTSGTGPTTEEVDEADSPGCLLYTSPSPRD